MIQETWMAEKMEKKFKDDPLDFRAGFVPLAVRQKLTTPVIFPSSWIQPHCSEQFLYNHYTANAGFMGLQFSESVSTHSKEESIISTDGMFTDVNYDNIKKNQVLNKSQELGRRRRDIEEVTNIFTWYLKLILLKVKKSRNKNIV